MDYSTTVHGLPRRVQDRLAIASMLNDAVGRVELAHEHVVDVRRTGEDRQIRVAEEGLCAAIQAAVDLGVRWGAIGTIVGVARGNAYQRYRRKRGGVPTDTSVGGALGNSGIDPPDGC